MDIVGGIDCGKAFLDIALYPDGDRLRVENSPVGFASLTTWLTEHGVRRVGIEASGGYERAVRNHLSTEGLAVQVFDPGRVRHFARAKGRRAKSDLIDAGVIAEFTAAFPDTKGVGIAVAGEALAGLIKARRLLVEKRGDVVRGATLAVGAARVALLDAAEQLAGVIEDLGRRIDDRVAADGDLAERARKLRSAPGVGSITANTFVALLPELGHTNGGKISALVGVAPFDDDSGQHRGQRHIAGGRADVREVLYMATLAAATRANGVIAAFYRRLRAQGKLPKVALIACMRKLVVRLNAMLANGEEWRDSPSV